jgi:hypothetical protein
VPARLTDLDTGTSWELLATPDTNAGEFLGAPWFRFRINHRSHAYITLAKPWISKHHGGVDYRQGRWWANDGGSVNTVTVNDEPIDRDRALENGDVLGFGQTRLRFETDGGPPARDLTGTSGRRSPGRG